MFKFYNMLWSDIILTARKNGNFTNKWKDFNYIISTFQGMNVVTLSILFKLLFDIKLPLNFKIDIFPGTRLDSGLVGLLLYFLPFFLMNYFLIIYKDRYKKIIILNKSFGGKLLFYYIFFSILLFFITILVWNIMGNVSD